MRLSRLWQDTDLAILVVLALLGVLLHTLTNGQYGFHRDELASRANPSPFSGSDFGTTGDGGA